MIKMLTNRTIYHSEDGYTVLSMIPQDKDFFLTEKEVTGILYCPIKISDEQLIEVEGDWINNKKYGKQFQITNFNLLEPATLKGMINYISDKFMGINKILAKRIVDKFGMDVIDVLNNNPNEILSIPNIGKKRIKMIIDDWNKNKGMNNLILELCKLGLSLRQASKVYKHFSKKTPNCDEILLTVKRCPYILIEISGISFATADVLGKHLSIPKDNYDRVKYGLKYLLELAATAGNCYLPHDSLLRNSIKLLDVQEVTIVTTLIQMNLMEEEGKRIISHDDKYYLDYLYDAERNIEKKLLLIQKHSMSRKTNKEFDVEGLNEQQKEAVITSLTNSVTLITGLAGTGKTTVINRIQRIYRDMGYSVELCAPTGKAARRISEVTGKEAMTIHRLLGYGQGQDVATKSIVANMVIVDECSMVDTLLMSYLIKALPTYCKLVLVGDINQLASIGPGNVLKDLIESELFSNIRLTEIYRQAKHVGIINLAHHIHNGIFPTDECLNNDNVTFIEEGDPNKINGIITSIVQTVKYPKEAIQVLSPMKKHGIGTNKLNLQLQKILNSKNTAYLPEDDTDRFILYLDDRVINVQNDYENEIFNGEIGYVKIKNKEETVIDFGSKVVNFDNNSIDQILLAYALTIHKSQGSQFPCVIIPVHETHKVMLERKLLYTGITRAEQKLILIGTRKALSLAVNNNHNEYRYTSLFKIKSLYTM